MVDFDCVRTVVVFEIVREILVPTPGRECNTVVPSPSCAGHGFGYSEPVVLHVELDVRTKVSEHLHIQPAKFVTIPRLEACLQLVMSLVAVCGKASADLELYPQIVHRLFEVTMQR